jgi:hypothetical protein
MLPPLPTTTSYILPDRAREKNAEAVTTALARYMTAFIIQFELYVVSIWIMTNVGSVYSHQGSDFWKLECRMFLKYALGNLRLLTEISGAKLRKGNVICIKLDKHSQTLNKAKSTEDNFSTLQKPPYASCPLLSTYLAPSVLPCPNLSARKATFRMPHSRLTKK